MKYWVDFQSFRETGFIGWESEGITEGVLNLDTLIRVYKDKTVIRIYVKDDSHVTIELSVKEGRRLLECCEKTVSWVRIPCVYHDAKWTVDIYAGYALVESASEDKPHWVGDEYKGPINFPHKTFKVIKK